MDHKDNTMKTVKTLLLTACLAPVLVFAQMTPAGLWKTIDDETGQEKSLVRIVDAGGTFNGAVEKSLLNDPNVSKVCDLCTDDRKGQVIVGMEIIRGVTKNVKDDGLWDGGEILDPQKGKTYRVRLTPKDGGAKLEVRGYVGMPLLGRTQTWLRVE
jgi:uncharacterized protein (DUF2147 family)